MNIGNTITIIAIVVITLTFILGISYAIYMNIRYKKEQDARINFYNSVSKHLNDK